MVRFFYKVDVQQKAKILRKARPPPRPLLQGPAPLQFDAQWPQALVVCTVVHVHWRAWRWGDGKPKT